VLDVLSAERDLEDAKTKAEIARQVLPLIEDVADPVEREAYRQSLARRLRVDERALQGWRPQPRRRRQRQAAPAVQFEEGAATRGPAERQAPMEGFCLGVLLANPELLYRVDRELQVLNLTRLSSQDFTGIERRTIFQAVREALAQEDEEPSRHWREALETPVDAVAEVLVGGVGSLDFGQPRVMDEIVANFLRLRKRTLESTLSELRVQLELTQESTLSDAQDTQEDLWRLTRQVQRLALEKDRLDRALARRQGSLQDALVGHER
jgi:DNA primase